MVHQTEFNTLSPHISPHLSFHTQVDPIRDTETIFAELRLKDIEYLTNNIEKVGKVVARMGDKDKVAKNEYETMLKVCILVYWYNFQSRTTFYRICT